MERMIYELVLWDAGNMRILGFFKTQKEAKDAMRLAKKYYAAHRKALQDRIADGVAGYEIITHRYGFMESVEICIRHAQELEAEAADESAMMPAT